MKSRYVWKIAFIWSVCSYQQRPASKWKCSELTHILQTSRFAFEFAGSYILSGNDLWNIILALVSIAMCDGYKLEPEECFQTNGTQENNFTDSGNYNSLVMERPECLSWTVTPSPFPLPTSQHTLERTHTHTHTHTHQPHSTPYPCGSLLRSPYSVHYPALPWNGVQCSGVPVCKPRLHGQIWFLSNIILTLVSNAMPDGYKTRAEGDSFHAMESGDSHHSYGLMDRSAWNAAFHKDYILYPIFMGITSIF